VVLHKGCIKAKGTVAEVLTCTDSRSIKEAFYSLTQGADA